MPVLTVFAGPNGSGKSSIIRRLDFEGTENLLQADEIAKRINSADPSRAAVAAAREVITRTRLCIRNHQSFAIETTLASGSTLVTIREAQQQGFFVNLVYVCLESPEDNIHRVRERFAQGGHFVPDDDVRRRYGRSLQNLTAALRFVDQAVVYDNSETEPRIVLEADHGSITWRGPSEPVWVTRVCDRMARENPGHLHEE